MDKMLRDFNNTKSGIFKEFGCPDEYFIKYVDNAQWKISSDDSVNFLSYTTNGIDFSNCVIVKRDGKPMVYTKEDYTMIIAIECVKTALVFNTSKRMG